MEQNIVRQLHSDFEKDVQKEQETGLEFWLARDLQELLGYAKWENFTKVVDKAKRSCENAGFEPSDHFLDVRKMVPLGLGTSREVDDIALTRYACYLIAQNGDPSIGDESDRICFQEYMSI